MESEKWLEFRFALTGLAALPEAPRKLASLNAGLLRGPQDGLQSHDGRRGVLTAPSSSPSGGAVRTPRPTSAPFAILVFVVHPTVFSVKRLRVFADKDLQ